ncbi:MAG: DNA polymerase III subunit delta [Coriobacteriales bacterium]|jgi:DNA polymerase-3 subunit delta|nr:DNA polymerase III subunit delta [Coriobacteriales bacterium]
MVATRGAQTGTASGDKTLLPVYLLNGDDGLKQETLLARLIKRIDGEGNGSLDSQTFVGAALKDPTVLLDACYTLPFIAAVRLVVIKDADKLVKTVQEALVSYLEKPSETTVLVLIATKLASNTRLFKAIKGVDAKTVIDCSSKKRYELPALVKTMALTHKLQLSTDVAAYLIERVGTSTVALNNELIKLASYLAALDRDSATKKDVQTVVARTAEVKPWDLADAFTKGDLGLTLKLRARMPEQSPHGLLALCVTRLRELLAYKALLSRGENPAQRMGRPDWQLKSHEQGAQRFESEQLRALLRDAAELEQQMKSGGNPDLLFESWLIKVCS